MKKYSLFVGLLGVTLFLAPMVSLICLVLFLLYRFIFRIFFDWCPSCHSSDFFDFT